MSDLADLEKRHLWHPFTPMADWCAADHEPLQIVDGQGCTLRDQHGRAYLDGNASIWTNVHGHRHPKVDAALRDQLDRIAHSSFLGFTHEPAIRLAKSLVDLFPEEKLSRVFFSDDGSTAIECAVRMALQFWKQTGHAERDTLLTFDRAYHGDTLGAASLGGLPVFKGSGNDFGYRVVRAGGLEALQKMEPAERQRLAAVIIEPLIQGAAGMRLWPTGMLSALSDWCRQNDVLLILDEVMTGFGRTGAMFACEREGVVPDFIALAKGLTAGYLPMAATLTTERVFEAFLGEGNTFFYGHSYTANPLGCAAALASLQIFEEERVLEQLTGRISQMESLLAEMAGHPRVMDVRQCGLIAGIEVGPFDPSERTGAKICLAAREHGLLTRPVLDTLVLMPPLCVSDSELAQMVDALRLAIDDVCGRE
jgi:adenosylmethionine-8-amino-7-oxononanoate aminotransferase